MVAKMKRIILLVPFLVGCGSRDDAINSFVEWCQKNTQESKVTLTISNWNSAMEIECIVPSEAMEKVGD